MAIAWYVLRSKPNKEVFLHGEVLAHDLEVFYPCIRAKTVNPRARKMKPYFPGYLFVQVDIQELPGSFWRWLPGSQGLVSFEDSPAWVPDAMIAAIRRKVDAINAAGGEQLLGLKHGEQVTINDGPFVEYEAIFDACVSGSERVRVLLKHLHGRLTPVEMPASQIDRIKEQQPKRRA
jgi:transcription antitermination factor NusG